MDECRKTCIKNNKICSEKCIIDNKSCSSGDEIYTDKCECSNRFYKTICFVTSSVLGIAVLFMMLLCMGDDSNRIKKIINNNKQYIKEYNKYCLNPISKFNKKHVLDTHYFKNFNITNSFFVPTLINENEKYHFGMLCDKKLKIRIEKELKNEDLLRKKLLIYNNIWFRGSFVCLIILFIISISLGIYFKIKHDKDIEDEKCFPKK